MISNFGNRLALPTVGAELIAEVAGSSKALVGNVVKLVEGRAWVPRMGGGNGYVGKALEEAIEAVLAGARECSDRKFDHTAR